MALNRAFENRQAKAGSRNRPDIGEAVKRLVNTLAFGLRNADSLIRDRYVYFLPVARHVKMHKTAGRRVFDGI